MTKRLKKQTSNGLDNTPSDGEINLLKVLLFPTIQMMKHTRIDRMSIAKDKTIVLQMADSTVITIEPNN